MIRYFSKTSFIFTYKYSSIYSGCPYSKKAFCTAKGFCTEGLYEILMLTNAHFQNLFDKCPSFLRRLFGFNNFDRLKALYLTLEKNDFCPIY